MAGTRATAMIDRLMEDDYLQEQLSAGAASARAAYTRARKVRAEQAVKDQKLYDHVRSAAGSITEAARRAAGKPEPEPKRRWRRLPVLLVGLALVALVRAMHREQRSAAGRDIS
jgi:hypothetical protein